MGEQEVFNKKPLSLPSKFLESNKVAAIKCLNGFMIVQELNKKIKSAT